MMTCPGCGGFVAREPATVVCRLCGRFGVVVDVGDAEWVRQRVRDFELRPRSAECLPDFALPPQPLVPHPGRGWLKLPGTPTRPRRGVRVSRRTALLT
jgi:hypothetical protein